MIFVSNRSCLFYWVNTYLLLHLPNLELMVAQLGVVDDITVVPVLLCDDVLYLPDESTASGSDSLRSSLKLILSLAHEGSLDTTGSNKLSSGGSNVVGGDNELLRGVATRDDAVSSLDEHVC